MQVTGSNAIAKQRLTDHVINAACGAGVLLFREQEMIVDALLWLYGDSSHCKAPGRSVLERLPCNGSGHHRYHCLLSCGSDFKHIAVAAVTIPQRASVKQ